RARRDDLAGVAVDGHDYLAAQLEAGGRRDTAAGHLVRGRLQVGDRGERERLAADLGAAAAPGLAAVYVHGVGLGRDGACGLEVEEDRLRRAARESADVVEPVFVARKRDR